MGFPLGANCAHLEQTMQHLKRPASRGFPGGSVVKTSPSAADGRGCGLDPGWEAKPHLPCGQNIETLTRSSIVTNSIKTLKMVPTLKKKKNKTKLKKKGEAEVQASVFPHGAETREVKDWRPWNKLLDSVPPV